MKNRRKERNLKEDLIMFKRSHKMKILWKKEDEYLVRNLKILKKEIRVEIQ
jgi:hypothetical protein